MVFVEFRSIFTKFWGNSWISSHAVQAFSAGFPMSSMGGVWIFSGIAQYILTSAQSFGSQDYHNKSLITIVGLVSVLFCENEQRKTKWIIVCSEENIYLGA